MSEETPPGEDIEINISEHDLEQFRRLDQFLAQKIPHLSRTFLKNLFKKQLITTEQGRLSLNKMPPSGTTVQIQVPPPISMDALAEDIPLEILYEDEHLLFVNKPQGMVTHPAPGNYNGTLVNAILHHCKDLKGIGEKIRPGIVHRLDKGTSGVMVVAKTQACHEGLIMLFSEHDIDRVYEAIAMNVKISPAGKLEGNIGRHPQHRQKMAITPEKGKHAATHYKVIHFYPKFSHVELKLETGRTHQIRVHMSTLLKAPLLCDATYGNPAEHLKRLGGKFPALLKDHPYPFLHAKKLGLIHPITKKELSFEVTRPKIFEDVLNLAKGES